jgi:ABC-type spermidine/putrescine transport system permease subunit I
MTVSAHAFPIRYRRRRGIFALLLPLIAYLGVFYAYPIAAMMFRSAGEPYWTIQHFAKLFREGIYFHVMWMTAEVATMVTIAALVLGYPVAYLLARLDRSKSNLLLILVLVPFWTSVLVRTYAWMVLLGRQGIVNQFLLAIGAIDQPLRLLNTTFALYIAMVHVLLPFMILPLYGVMRGLDEDLLRAAQSLGAAPVAVFRQVWLPLSLPGVFAGCLLVFILALGFFITPALVGGPRDLMIAVLIQQQVDLFNWPFASALAVVLLTASLIVFAVFERSMGVARIFGGCRHEADGAAADRRSRALLPHPADPYYCSALVFVGELSEFSSSRVQPAVVPQLLHPSGLALVRLAQPLGRARSDGASDNARHAGCGGAGTRPVRWQRAR